MTGIANSFTRALVSDMEMAAAWFSPAIVTGEGRAARVAPGATVRIEDGRVVDVESDKPATHRVIGVFGNIAGNSLKLIACEIADESRVEIINLL
jgi:hypothetical protein